MLKKTIKIVLPVILLLAGYACSDGPALSSTSGYYEIEPINFSFQSDGLPTLAYTSSKARIMYNFFAADTAPVWVSSMMVMMSGSSSLISTVKATVPSIVAFLHVAAPVTGLVATTSVAVFVTALPTDLLTDVVREASLPVIRTPVMVPPPPPLLPEQPHTSKEHCHRFFAEKIPCNTQPPC